MTEQAHRPRSAPGPLLYSVEEAAQLLGIGRTLTFELIATGAIASIKIGRCRKISRDALDEYIERLRTDQPTKVLRTQNAPSLDTRDL